MNKEYFHNLDALRFFAFLSVFVSHAVLFFGYNNGTQGFAELRKLFFVHGDLGVTFFFVLSGFLLTYLFLQEKKNTGSINLKFFYKKRILRIWPVYMLTIVLGFFVTPLIASFFDSGFGFNTTFDISSILWYLFFAGNLHMSFFSAPNLIVAILWFISAQEQFYLFWPTLLKYFSPKKILYSIIFIVLASTVFRFFYIYNYNLVHYFTVALMSDIAIGALVACAVEYSPRLKNKFVSLSKFQIAMIYIATLFFVPIKGILPDVLSGNIYRLVASSLPLVFAVLFAFVIIEQTYATNSFFKFGKSKKLTYLGKISYGLYAYHIFALFIVQVFMKIIGMHTKYDDLATYAFVLVATFLTTILLAQISFKYMEKKFLKLKTQLIK